jgi:pimeloyl-ACP methyl ester carboxylesterase
MPTNDKVEQTVQIPIGSVSLSGDLTFPEGVQGIVLFAHGSGSGRKSPRNRFVAGVLHDAGLGTLLFDLLTQEEEVVDAQTRHLRFDIVFRSNRLVSVTDWLVQDRAASSDLGIGYFGASTGAAASLVAASKRAGRVRAIVSHRGRPDLADPYLSQVRAPTLLIVGGYDTPVIQMNQEALDKLKRLSLEKDEKKLVIVPEATHLFEEPSKLERVAQLPSEWCASFLSEG